MNESNLFFGNAAGDQLGAGIVISAEAAALGLGCREIAEYDLRGLVGRRVLPDIEHLVHGHVDFAAGIVAPWSEFVDIGNQVARNAELLGGLFFARDAQKHAPLGVAVVAGEDRGAAPLLRIRVDKLHVGVTGKREAVLGRAVFFRRNRNHLGGRHKAHIERSLAPVAGDGQHVIRALFEGRFALGQMTGAINQAAGLGVLVVADEGFLRVGSLRHDDDGLAALQFRRGQL